MGVFIKTGVYIITENSLSYTKNSQEIKNMVFQYTI